jgi:hypothetical protein
MTAEQKPSRIAWLKKKLIPSKRDIFDKLGKSVRWADRKVPHVARTAIGIPLMIGGVFSFLPVLGLWMLPAGAALVALDFPGPRRRLLRWLDRKEREHATPKEAAGKDG